MAQHILLEGNLVIQTPLLQPIKYSNQEQLHINSILLDPTHRPRHINVIHNLLREVILLLIILVIEWRIPHLCHLLL